jgi:hypothetical protein
MSAKDADACASALADLWERAQSIGLSIEEMSRGEELTRPLIHILRELEDLDWEALWLTSRARKVWRHTTGSAWMPTQEELEATGQSIHSWWHPKDSLAKAAPAIVELRRLARRLAVELTPYQLLAIGKSRRASDARKSLRRLVEQTIASASTLKGLFEDA